MNKNNKNNFKKLLCYNIVNNMKCLYKNKCMFAHDIEEQIKEPLRDFIYNMIFTMNDLSEINIKENQELFEELVIFTKECKNCLNNKCPGGYNCKYGVCLKNLKICHCDLLYGRCALQLNKECINNKQINKCINGIHLTEKNLIPYYQRLYCEMNNEDKEPLLFNNINYYSKINTLSIKLNDNTIKIIKNLINKNKITKNDLMIDNLYQNNIEHLIISNDDISNDDVSKIENQNIDNKNFYNEILQENKEIKQIQKIGENINYYFWRYKPFDKIVKNTQEIITNSSNDLLNTEKLNEVQDITKCIKNILDTF